MINFTKELMLFLVGVLALAAAPGESANSPLHLDWKLADGDVFFRQMKPDAAEDSRQYQLDVPKAQEEGLAYCNEEARTRKNFSPACEGLHARLAPVFNFAFHREKPIPMFLTSIKVRCYKAFRHRAGEGYAVGLAAYDIPLPVASKTERTFDPPVQFTFTNQGVLRLRLWPDFKSGNVDAMDVEIRFHFESGEEVSSGRFRLLF